MQNGTLTKIVSFTCRMLNEAGIKMITDHPDVAIATVVLDDRKRGAPVEDMALDAEEDYLKTADTSVPHILRIISKQGLRTERVRVRVLWPTLLKPF